MVSFSSMAMAAALTISSSSAQQLIFIPTTTTTHAQMTPSFSSLNNNNEPPCRTRRLEPWRQQVREHCRVDATSNCRHNNNIEKEERRATSQNFFEDEMNNFFDSIFSPPQSSQQQHMNNNIEDPFDSLVRNMLGFSLNAFDQIMAEATAQQQPSTIKQLLNSEEDEGQDEVNEEGVDNYPNEEDVDVGEENYPDVDGEDWDQFDEEQEGFEEVGEGKVSTQEDTEQDNESSEDAAASAMATMDALVANLAHRSIHRTGEEGAGAQEDTTSLFLDNLPKKLFEMGNNILAETTHSRRRLMEVGEGEEKIDPHLQVRERLGRRLTEYRQDLFLHPSDGTVTLYTRGLMSSPPVMTIRGYHPQEKIVGLGLGDDVDECMESRFHNGDLDGECSDAVQMFFLAVNDRTLIPPSSPIAMKRRAFMRDMHRAPVARRQQVFTFTSDADEMNHFKCMLFWAPTLLLLLLLVMGKVCGSDDDDEDEEDAQDVSFDYSKLPEDGIIEYVSPPCEGFSMQNVPSSSEPKVFVGVPVQVV